MSKEGVFKDTVANLAEHFGDYVVIVRQPEGLIWKMSDRTFACGAVQRLSIRLATEDQMATRPFEGGPDCERR